MVRHPDRLSTPANCLANQVMNVGSDIQKKGPSPLGYLDHNETVEEQDSTELEEKTCSRIAGFV